MSDGLRNSAQLVRFRISKKEHRCGARTGSSLQETVAITVSDETIEDPSVFALEKNMEEFLVTN